MLGNVGTGKTHLAVASMRHFEKALLVKQSTLLWRLRKTYRDASADDPIEPCQKTKLLVIDEMGLSQGGRDELPMLFEILDYRHGEFLPTILTGNIEWPEMAELLGARLVDRLRQSAFNVLNFGGNSHRPRGKADYFAGA
jgi:DNA replication protein DnaC